MMCCRVQARASWYPDAGEVLLSLQPQRSARGQGLRLYDLGLCYGMDVGCVTAAKLRFADGLTAAEDGCGVFVASRHMAAVYMALGILLVC